MKRSKKETDVKTVSKKKLSIDVEDKNKGGRPPVVLSDEQILQVEALAAFLPIQKISDYLSISEKTFREIRDRDSEVFTAYYRGVARAHALAGGVIMKFMSYEDNIPNIAQLQMQLDAAKFYLRTQAGWSEKSKDADKPQDNNLNITIKIKDHENLDHLTDEQVKELKKEGCL